MSDYIKRDDVQDYLRGLLVLGNAVFIDPAKEIEIVESIPAADVHPVRRGYWLFAYDGYLHCSKCAQKAPVVQPYQDEPVTVATNFCPFCGAKMEGAEID